MVKAFWLFALCVPLGATKVTAGDTVMACGMTLSGNPVSISCDGNSAFAASSRCGLGGFPPRAD